MNAVVNSSSFPSIPIPRDLPSAERLQAAAQVSRAHFEHLLGFLGYLDSPSIALVRQAWHPVRWVETVQAMKAQGVTHIVECGPGKVLNGLTKRIDKDLVGLAITDPASMQAALELLQG